MLNSDTKGWIKYYVEDYYEMDMISTAIDRLDAYLEYIHNHENDEFYIHILEMYAATDLKKRQLLKDFADIESFMGRMGGILNLKTTEKFKPFYDGEKENWTLGHLLKQAFCVIDENDNLNKISKPDELAKRFVQNESRGLLKVDRTYHYLMVYGFRNTSSHFDEERNLSKMTKKQIDEVICSMLVIELDLCIKYSKELEKIYQKSKEENLKKSYDLTLYARDIEALYQKKCEEGFSYLDTYWDVIDNYDKKKKNIADFVSLNGCIVTFFLGVAGTGKTTALRQLEYLCALKCKSNHGQKYIPVYIELKKLSPGSNPIQFEIGKQLQYGTEVVTQIIKDRNLILLLDGWNEIRNKEVKNQIRDELNQLINKYDQKVFITDRSENSNVLNTAKEISKCHLHELSYDAKREYLEKYCTPEAYEMVLEQLERERGDEDGLKPIYNLKTPLMLYYFSQVVSEYGKITGNFVSKYIELLFKREEAEQKDADDPRSLDSVRYILAALAIKFEKGIFMKGEALLAIGDAKRALGFIQPDSMECLDLSCKMGILEKEEDIYQFVSDEFQDYFEGFAINNGVDEYFRR